MHRCHGCSTRGGTNVWLCNTTKIDENGVKKPLLCHLKYHQQFMEDCPEMFATPSATPSATPTAPPAQNTTQDLPVETLNLGNLDLKAPDTDGEV